MNEKSSIDDEAVRNALSMASSDVVGALKIVDEAFSGTDLPWVKQCVHETVLHWYLLSRPSERDVYSWFIKNYKSKLGDCFEIIDKRTDRKNIPDFWVTDGCFDYPVECKLHEFDAKALNQLQRYMEAYKCSRGIAVGASLTAKLPDSIMFVAFDDADLEV